MLREVVRSVQGNQTQFAAIDWSGEEIFRYKVLLMESSDNEDQQQFNEAVEALYKKWLLGEDVPFTIRTKTLEWNLEQEPQPAWLNQPEKNEYLSRKALKRVRQFFNDRNAARMEQQISELGSKLEGKLSTEQLTGVHADAKALDEEMKKAVEATKNQSTDAKWSDNGIDNNTYLDLRTKLNLLFDRIKQLRADSFDTNYNTIAPRVEAAYMQSRTAENFSDTRKDLVALQKELIAYPLERWQKNELMDRLRSAFNVLNERQDAWRAQQDSLRASHTETLQKQYDLVIPQALNSPFSEGFGLLKELQDLTNKSSVLREKRDQFYTMLDAAFKAIKEKADSEQDANFEQASKQVDIAIAACAGTEMFKDARQILIGAQNELKETRLKRKQKDELFTRLRAAFEKLNEEQDAWFNKRRKENRNQLEDTLQQMKRILARKKEGMESLYQAKSNVEAKAGIIKVDKKSDGSIAGMFKERLTAITDKVAAAEKDIAQLEKKIAKIEKEIREPEN